MEHPTSLWRRVRKVVLTALSLGAAALAQEPATSRPESPPAASVSAARDALTRGDGDAALEIALELLRAAPADVELNLLACEAAWLAGNLRTARHHADAAAASAPSDPRPEEWNGHILFAMGDKAPPNSGFGGLTVRATFADAAAAYAAAAEKGGDRYKDSYWEADARSRAGDQNGALKALERALAVKPADPQAILFKARVLLDQRDHAGAASVLTDFLAKDPSGDDAAAGATLLVRARLASGDRRKLADDFVALTARYPDCARSAFDLVWSSLSDVAGDELWPDLLRRAEAIPTNGDLIIFYKADLAFRRGRTAEALELSREYRRRNPNEAVASYRVGWAELREKLLDDARKSFGRAFDLGLDKPEMANGYRNLVAAFHGARRFKDAAEIQEFVVSLTGAATDALDHGIILLDDGRPDAALPIYQQILARDEVTASERAKTWNHIGLLKRGRGDAKSAEEAFRKALECDDADLDSNENLGILLIDTNRAEEGIRHLEKCRAAAPTRRRPLYHLLAAQFPRLFESVR